MPWQDIVAGGVDEWSDYGDTDDEHGDAGRGGA